jgi:hypothetical protein
MVIANDRRMISNNRRASRATGAPMTSTATGNANDITSNSTTSDAIAPAVDARITS